MSSKLPSAADEALRIEPIVLRVLRPLEDSTLMKSRYLTKVVDGYAGRMTPRCIGEDGCRQRMTERLGVDPSSDMVSHPAENLQGGSEYDKTVYAVRASFESFSHTLPQMMSVFPNLETFYAPGATVDLTSDRFVVMHSDMDASEARTAIIDRLVNGFFNPQALSSCPEVKQGSELSRRNLPRLQRLKRTLAQTRYIRFTNPSPFNGPHATHDGATGIVYNLSAFGRIIRDRTSADPSVPILPIDTLEFNLLNDDRLRTYQRIANLPIPDSFNGVSAVLISSPGKAPDLFDLLSDDVFPGQLTNMKTLRIDVSIPRQGRQAPDTSWANKSTNFPHLENITFRLYGQVTDDVASEATSDDPTAATAQEGEDKATYPTADDLARPFQGSTTRIAFVPASAHDDLLELCTQATGRLNPEGSE